MSLLITLALALTIVRADDSSITDAPAAADDNPYTMYPSVAKTASINGFADRIYDLYPDCAKPCLFQNTGLTPCPYWDTGCLCVMPNFAGAVGLCIAESCRGDDVVVATSLATSICSSAGVWDPYWMAPASVKANLDSAATAVATSPEASSDVAPTSSADVAEQTSSEQAKQTEEPSSEQTEETEETEQAEVPSTSEPETSADASITTPPITSSTTRASVSRTASINGFADHIYDLYPECAKQCLFQDTGITPCPYWDAGCLCVMPMFAGAVGQCIADSCRGDDVVVATSLASSICSSAGVPEPYWRAPASVKSSLDYAVTAIATSDELSSEATATPSSSSEQEAIETESQESVSSTDPSITPAPSITDDNPYTMYPSVAKTASINGFADRIYDLYPDCAKPCLFQDTGVTPCPYWDTGCLCVMPNFAGAVGLCIAESCRGDDVVVATSLATSICSSAGVWDPYWMAPASVKANLDSAATAIITSDEASSDATATSSTDISEEISSESETASAESDVSSTEPESSTESSTESVSESTAAEPSSSEGESSEDVSFTSAIPSATPSLVTCYLNGEAIDQVDYETGICDFELPSDLESFFNFESVTEYDIQYFYARVNGNQYTNDIRSAGRVISIPARVLYQLVSQVHQVHLQESGESGSTQEERRKKRDEVDDFIDSATNADGTPVDVFLSVDVVPDTSSVSVVPTSETASESSTFSASASVSAESESGSESESESVSESVSTTGLESESGSVETSELPSTITATETCTDEEGNVITETLIITTHVTEYCEQTSAAGVQSSAKEEQSSAKSVQNSAASEQAKIVTVIVSCESAISSVESVKSSAEAAHETEIVASCESELSSIKSVESEARVTITSLVEVQESCISKQTSLVEVQSSAVSVQLSAAKAQESSRAVERAQSAGDQIETVTETVTSFVSHNTVAAGSSSLRVQTTSAEQASETAHVVALANVGASFATSALALIVSSGIFIGILI